jgi:hypothetical protein
MVFRYAVCRISHSAEGLAGEGGQNEGSLVDIGVVVAAELLLLFLGPGSKGLGNVTGGVLAADHESNLARGVGGDSGVTVLGDGEDLLAVFLELGDQWQVEPLVLSYESMLALLPQGS